MHVLDFTRDRKTSLKILNHAISMAVHRLLIIVEGPSARIDPCTSSHKCSTSLMTTDTSEADDSMDYPPFCWYMESINNWSRRNAANRTMEKWRFGVDL